ncbi:hypothetical protein YPPY19_2214, partial [Yersinia pestis PY-19]
MPIRANTRTNG